MRIQLQPECIPTLIRTLAEAAPKERWENPAQGNTCSEDARELRRIAMTLHRWHELECGVDGGGVERDETTGKCMWYNSNTGRRSPYPDRETPARKRLAKIMARYPDLTAYVQGDPRGTALYSVTTPVRRDPSERWSDDSTTIRAYNSAQAIQTARSRLRRYGFEMGMSSTQNISERV